MVEGRTSNPGAGTRSRLRALAGRHRAASAAIGLALLCVVALVAVLLVQPRQAPQGPFTRGHEHGATTSPPPSSSSTTGPTSTTRPAATARSTPPLYPAYLPTGVGAGSLVVDSWTPPTFGGYVQSYYGTSLRGQSLPELVIGGPEAEQMFATSGLAPQSAVLAGYPVTLWRIVSTEQAAAGAATVTGLTATIDGHAVSLIGVSLSDAELGTVLEGLRPRPSGDGWDTGALPASLVLVAQGGRSEDPSFVPYRVQFSSDLALTVTHDVVIPRGACVCNAESWPVALTAVGSAPAAVLDMLPTGAQPGQLHQIEWQYSPDADVVLTFGGITVDEALRIAASVGPAPSALWASLPCTKTAPGAGGAICDPQQELPTTS